jgi:AcrR family transcriptional regulator
MGWAVADRPRRADALRNRAAVLQAAGDIFAARGAALSTEEVARAAGVGVGTVFRHFPTKEALLEALYRDRLDRTAERAHALAQAPDPGAAFFEFLNETVLGSGAKIALADALADAGIDIRSGAAAAGHDLAAALGVLLTRAQKAGAVRADLRLPELTAVLFGASRAAGFAVSAEVRSRTVGIILDGLRPASASSR